MLLRFFYTFERNGNRKKRETEKRMSLYVQLSPSVAIFQLTEVGGRGADDVFQKGQYTASASLQRPRNNLKCATHLRACAPYLFFPCFLS